MIATTDISTNLQQIANKVKAGQRITDEDVDFLQFLQLYPFCPENNLLK